MVYSLSTVLSLVLLVAEIALLVGGAVMTGGAPRVLILAALGCVLLGRAGTWAMGIVQSYLPTSVAVLGYTLVSMLLGFLEVLLLVVAVVLAWRERTRTRSSSQGYGTGTTS